MAADDQAYHDGVPRSTAGTETGPGRGHQEKASRIGRTDYWLRDEWIAGRNSYANGKSCWPRSTQRATGPTWLTPARPHRARDTPPGP
jgi:hypothetical protein